MIARFYRTILLAVASVTFPLIALAEDMVLVKDINVGPRALQISLRCTLGGEEYLFADDQIRGAELWKGNGLSGSTHLVKDINPGSSGGFPGGSCVEMGGNLYFIATDGVHGVELWKSDDTTSGTLMVKDINSGSESSTSAYMETIGSVLLFLATDGLHGS